MKGETSSVDHNTVYVFKPVLFVNSESYLDISFFILYTW